MTLIKRDLYCQKNNQIWFVKLNKKANCSTGGSMEELVKEKVDDLDKSLDDDQGGKSTDQVHSIVNAENFNENGGGDKEERGK